VSATTTSIGTSTSQHTNQSGPTPLAERLRADRPEDSRDCHREDCEGTLSLVEHSEWGVELVLCQLCRTTPSGQYIPPIEPSSSSCDGREGWGKCPTDHYPHSGNLRLAGGFEEPYDEDDDRRPSGVTSDYTFDLTTY